MPTPTFSFAAVTAAAIAVVAAAAPAEADVLTVLPPGNAAAPGDSINIAPLRLQGTGGGRSQLVYESQLFANFGGPRAITGFDLRTGPNLAPSLFIGNAVTVSNILIRLSTTARGDEGNPLSAAFADNIGADATTVYAGALTLTTAANFNAPVSPFDYAVTFQTPFTYDPGLGNLLVDILIPADASLTASGLFGFLGFDTVAAPNDGAFGVYSTFNPAATSGSADTGAPILRVHSEAAAVPEPSTLALLAGGLIAAGLRRRRRAAAPPV